MKKRRKTSKEHTVDRSNILQQKPVISIDIERYQHMLDNSDLSEDQKRELLQTIWNGIVECVSLGFGVHPLQQLPNDCGKTKEKPALSTLTGQSEVFLNDDILNELNLCADKEDGGSL